MRSSEIRQIVIRERRKGVSFKKIAVKFNIPEGTVYSWIKDLKLSNFAKEALKKSGDQGRVLGRQVTQLRREEERLTIKQKALDVIKELKINKFSGKVLCAFLFWAEGAKTEKNVTFINSDPVMIKTFLFLFRKCFEIDEKKFRLIVHIHEYHDEEKILNFWSNETGVPLSQFNRSYRKQNTGKNKKENYKGCLSIRYYDYKIAQELFCLYNIFSRQVLSKGYSVNG